jgi:hypothetical protein
MGHKPMHPIPLPTSPLKGEETLINYSFGSFAASTMVA